MTQQTKQQIDAVILTALEVEYMAVRAHLTNIKEITDHPTGTIYEQGIFTYNGKSRKSLKVAIAEIGQGNINAAKRTEMAIQYFNPSVILFVGVAGGIKDVKLGDVVAADKVYDYEYGKAEATFKTRPELYRSTPPMIERARKVRNNKKWHRRFKNRLKKAPNSNPQIFVGHIASGDKVLASPEAPLYEFIRDNYNDALAIEMEGYGFLEAVNSHPNVKALVIRGISDLIENKEESDKSGFQKIASQHASAFAFEILAKTAQPLNLKKVIKSYKQYIIQMRDKERSTEFPKGARFIESSIKLRVKQSHVEQPYIKISAEKEVEWKSIKMKNLLKEGEKFVLIADSGLGKTTLLKELQYQIASDIFTKQIPIYFHFGHLIDVFSTDDLLERIRDKFSREMPKEDIKQAVDAFFDEKRFIFLLDGLDQIENKNNLRILLDKNGLLSSHHVILAGRPYIYSLLQNLLSHYEYLTLDTFSIQQTMEYLGEDTYKSFENLLHEPTLRAPMILFILKHLGKDVDKKVVNRTQIYEKMVHKLLPMAAENQTIQSYPISEQRFRNVFSELSYILINKGYAGRFPRDAVDSLLPGLNITKVEFDRFTHIGIISEIMEGSSTHGSDLIFRHQSFQEYFAALELKKRIFSQSKINEQELLNHLEYMIWDEAFLFLVGSLEKGNAKELISYLSHYDLYFAGRAVAHYDGNKDEDFPEIIDRLFEKIHFYDARETLGKIGTEGIITTLLSLSKDENTCEDAISALGLIGSEKAVEHLILLVRDEDEDVRWNAAFALGEIGSEKAIEHLIPLLRDEDKYVRKNAAFALGEIGSEKAIEHLIPLLRDEDEDVRSEAAYVLGKIGSEKAVEHLIPLLKDKDELVRKDAAFALGKIGSEKAVEHLIPLLKDKDTIVRRNAASALGKIGSEKAVEHLIPLLKDKDELVRKDAAFALGEIGSEKAVEHLIPLLKDKDELVRKDAAFALGEIGSEKAVKHLIPLLKDKDVRWEAASALGKIDSKKAVEHLIPLLKDLLKDKDEDVRKDAAFALGEIGSEKAVKHLIPLLKDKDELVRKDAAFALGEIGSEKAVEHLIPLLKDKDKYIRSRAADALAKIGSKKAIEHLISLLKDKDELVRRSTAFALGEIGSEKAVEHLIPLLKDEDEDVRSEAASALGKIGSKKAIEHLISLLKDKDELVRRSTAFALGKIGSEKAIEHLIPLLKDEDTIVRSDAASALGESSKQLTEQKLRSLIERLHKEQDNEAIMKIQEIRERRFLNILYSEE